MDEAREILKKHWGYPDFRPNQKPVVEAVLAGKHTLALLPTGGGKSICYQVPVLAREGLGVVISPLISLMDDQVAQLRSKGIKTVNLAGRKQLKDLDRELDNCIYDNVKFLFLSPERLENELVRARIAKMKVNLLVIDEAHCISQWGHDFRPSYLKIKTIHEHAKAQILALTATATANVVRDIKEFAFPKPEVVTTVRGDFFRPNLAFFVQQTENKQQQVLNVCKKQRGSGIIYVRSRKATAFWEGLLRENGFNALPYHAGMTSEKREAHQSQWMQSNQTIMVATSAFGMGIDKPNVRFVIHPEIPESLEAFIQEAGRAGRDGKKAFSVLLYHQQDVATLENRLLHQLPPKAEVTRVYQLLLSYWKVAFGTGLGQEIYFNLQDAAQYCKVSPTVLLRVLDVLKAELLLDWQPPESAKPKVQIKVSARSFYQAEIKNPALSKVMQALGRMYQGIFEFPTVIHPQKLAQYCELQTNQLIAQLQRLQQMQLIAFTYPKNAIRCTLLVNRGADSRQKLRLDKYDFLEQRSKTQYQSILQYLNLPQNACRQQHLCAYFGDTIAACGSCDLCLQQKENKEILTQLETLVQQKERWSVEQLMKQDYRFKLHPEDFYQGLRTLAAHGVLQLQKDTVIRIQE